MVSPYPPARDGIAAYAVQAVARLRAEGHDVEVLSPGPSAAHHHLDLTGARGALALARRARRYDRVIVQFHPDVFFPVPCHRRPSNTRALPARPVAATVSVRSGPPVRSCRSSRRWLPGTSRVAPFSSVKSDSIHATFATTGWGVQNGR